MGKLKKFLAVTAAWLICSGTMAYMPQGSFINADINTAYAAEGSVAINATNFPDDIFRGYIAENFDKDEDGVLSAEEIATIIEIHIDSKGISDLNGIEYFTALTYLSCNVNSLTSLDVSKNTALKNLYCAYNQLTSLDLSRNIKLSQLGCEDNQLSLLNISQNSNLEQLDCGNNQLTSLDISKNTSLLYLTCQSNLLTSLDVSNNIALKLLDCGNNQLTSLDISRNTSITSLSFIGNQLTTLDIRKNVNLEQLNCGYNQLTSLDISNNTALEMFICIDNQLTSLDVSNNTELTYLYCDYNSYEIPLTDGKFDLSTLPTGFDIAKASEWTNGTVEGNILTVEDDTKAVTYTYDCGNEKTASFTLIPTGEPITPPIDEPALPLGDINGDSKVDASDASNVLAVYALVSTGKESGLTEAQIAAADVNKDGKIDSSDASIILAYYAYIQTGGTGTIEEYLSEVRD